MLDFNTMQFGTDKFIATEDNSIGERKALLIAKEPFDTTAVSSVNKFVISGVQPATTQRAILLKIDNKIYKFNGTTLTQININLTAEEVLANGNTVDELIALNNIPSLLGKSIYPIIALRSASEDSPTIKLGLNTSTASATKTKTINTPEYPLTAPDGVIPIITEISTETTCAGQGKVTVTVQVKSADGKWGKSLALDEVTDLEGTAVKFKFVYSVVNVGTDSAKVDSVAVKYLANTQEQVVSGTVADIYSVIPNLETDLRTCYLVVRHKKLRDSQIEAFANFFPEPKHRERILIGKGTGAFTQYTLGVGGVADKQIDHRSIKVYVDGVPTDSFDYNTETGELSIEAPLNQAVLASYDYDCGVEEWLPMIREFNQQPYSGGWYMTRFTCSLPEDAEPSTSANVRIRLLRVQGSVADEALGTATGLTQQFVLPHAAIADSISINADFTYDADTQVLTAVAAQGTKLNISYDFFGEPVVIKSWAAGWSV